MKSVVLFCRVTDDNRLLQAARKKPFRWADQLDENLWDEMRTVAVEVEVDLAERLDANSEGFPDQYVAWRAAVQFGRILGTIRE